MHFPRLLVVGQPVGDECAQLFFHLSASRKPFPQSNERHRNLPRRRIRTPHHSALPHRRMFQQHSLHLRRSHRKSLVLDHLLAPVHHPVKALGIASDHVPRPIPSIAQHGRSRLWFFPVTLHELRSTHHQLTRLANRNLRRIFRGCEQIFRANHSALRQRQGMPDRIRPVQVRLQVTHVRHRRSFRHAISLNHGNSGQRRESSRQVRRQRRSSRLHPVHFVI